MAKDEVMDCDKLLSGFREILRAEPTVKFAYAFGSVAARSAGPLSDIDVAVYIDSKTDAFSFRLVLMERLIRGLGKENKPHRVLFETATLSEYLDFSPFRAAQSISIRRQIETGDYFG